MRLNYFGYYMDWDGYGRWNSRLAAALINQGVKVKVATPYHYTMPPWLQKYEGIDHDALSVSCFPPYALQKLPGRQWLITMTEGSRVPQDWVDNIHKCNVERLLVPCEHNKIAFEESGVSIPIHILPGGTDPKEFPLILSKPERPYTFLTFCDRGERKGWTEVWDAFYEAFGGKTTGEMNVRLIMKTLREKDSTLFWMAGAEGADPRVQYIQGHTNDIINLYRQADCLVLPSRSEGWGMIHREAASCGLPVITQLYSGMDDGNALFWSLPVGGTMRPIPKPLTNQLGEWMVADVKRVARAMKFCYENPVQSKLFGTQAAGWIASNQTWKHSAMKLMEIINDEDCVERAAVSEDKRVAGGVH